MTDTEASDFIDSLIKAAWQANAETIVGIGKAASIRWEGKQETGNPVGFWLRVSKQIVTQQQASFADENTFGSHKRRYETFGLVFCQLFCPKSEINSFRKGRDLAGAIRNALANPGLTQDVWFQFTRIQPLPEDGSSYRWNVVSDVRYDEIR